MMHDVIFRAAMRVLMVTYSVLGPCWGRLEALLGRLGALLGLLCLQNCDRNSQAFIMSRCYITSGTLLPQRRSGYFGDDALDLIWSRLV